MREPILESGRTAFFDGLGEEQLAEFCLDDGAQAGDDFAVFGLGEAAKHFDGAGSVAVTNVAVDKSEVVDEPDGDAGGRWGVFRMECSANGLE